MMFRKPGGSQGALAQLEGATRRGPLVQSDSRRLRRNVQVSTALQAIPVAGLLVNLVKNAAGLLGRERAAEVAGAVGRPRAPIRGIGGDVVGADVRPGIGSESRDVYLVCLSDADGGRVKREDHARSAGGRTVAPGATLGGDGCGDEGKAKDE